MRIKIEQAWLNNVCNECGKIIYPENVYRILPGKNRTITWKFCKECFEKNFKIKKEKENQEAK